jgi:probable lipoprotein NlpC
MLHYEEWLGTPFKVGGTDKQGIDCYNLCKEVSKEVGINLPFMDSPDQPSLIDNLISNAKPLFTRVEQVEPYCLVTFTVKPPYISHIGIVLEDCNKFLHILNNKRGVAVEKLDNISWQKRIEGFYKYVG